MKTKQFLGLMLIEVILLLLAGCNRENITKESDQPEINQELTYYEWSGTNTDFSWNYMRVGTDGSMLLWDYDDQPSKLVYVFQNDTLAVYFNSQGLPEEVFYKDQILVFRNHRRNKCDAVWVPLNSDAGNISMQLETDFFWEQYIEDFMTPQLSCKGVKRDKYVLKTADIRNLFLAALPDLLEAKAPIGTLLNKLVETIGYKILDENQFESFDLYVSIVEAVGAIAAASTVGLLVANYDIWWNHVIKPVIENWPVKIILVDNALANTKFAVDSVIIPVEGMDKIVSVSFAEGISVNDVTWNLVNDFPDWIVYPVVFPDKLFFHVLPNTTQAFRSHRVECLALDKAGWRWDFYLIIKQLAPISVVPDTLLFDRTGGTQRVKVNSVMDWKIASWPDWCVVQKEGLSHFSVKVEENNSETRHGTIVVASNYEGVQYQVETEIFQTGEDEEIIYIPDENFRAYLSGSKFIRLIDGGGGRCVLTKQGKSARTIFCPDYQIKSLEGIQYFTQVTTIGCSDNQLTHLDVSKCVALTELSCCRNQLVKLNVSGCKELWKLYCYNNNLDNLDVTDCSLLVELECENNQLTTLDISKCPRLNWVKCNGNSIKYFYLVNTKPWLFAYDDLEQIIDHIDTYPSHKVVYYYQLPWIYIDGKLSNTLLWRYD